MSVLFGTDTVLEFENMTPKQEIIQAASSSLWSQEARDFKQTLMKWDDYQKRKKWVVPIW